MSIWFWFWAVLAAILIVLEIFTAGFFMLPFGLGAAVAAAMEWLLPGKVGLQWIAFIVVSGVALVLLRRFADQITHDPPENVGVDRVLGKVGVVTEALDPMSPIGRVRIHREEWRAETPDDSSLPEGTKVVVERIEGTRLIVVPLKDEGALASAEPTE